MTKEPHRVEFLRVTHTTARIGIIYVTVKGEPLHHHASRHQFDSHPRATFGLGCIAADGIMSLEITAT